MSHRALSMPPIPRRSSNSDDNVMPLINVVFLLLIFFMVSGTLLQEPPFDITPATTHHAPEQDAQPDYLAIGADGRLAWGGEAIEEDTLGLRLRARQAVDSPLQVRADRRLRARELNDLLAILRANGVARIQLLTEKR